MTTITDAMLRHYNDLHNKARAESERLATVDELNYWIALAIREGNLRIKIRNDEANQAANQRQAEAEAEIKRQWTPIIEAIKETIPPWVHQFLTHSLIHPQAVYDSQSHTWPAVIRIPDTATVYAYVDGERIGWLPAQFAVSDDDETWSVIDIGGHPKTFWELEHVNRDFYIALAEAAAWEKRLPELQAEADRRNADRHKAKPEPATNDLPTLDFLALADKAARAFDWPAAAALAQIGILQQLKKVTTPLYNGSQHAIQIFDTSRD